MNYKHYFPTFRTRWLFLERSLEMVASTGRTRRILHLGCGEGDHDRIIKRHCEELIATDLNPGDVEHARRVNGAVSGIEYRVEDGLALSFPNAHFDAVVCMEVIEHVKSPERLLSEMARVLEPGGRAIFTFPTERFPFTYDPINGVLRLWHKHLPIGAYAYGHDWLVGDVIDEWLGAAGFSIVFRRPLTGWLTGAIECYWAGGMQRAMKPNSRNSLEPRRVRGVRPQSDRQPPGVGLVDRLIDLDALLSARTQSSVGLGYVIERNA